MSRREAAEQRVGIGNRLAPARFLMFLAIFAVVSGGTLFVNDGAQWKDCVVIGFDVAAVCFLLSLWPVTRTKHVDQIRRHAALNDANRGAMLAIATVAVIAVMAAISGVLAQARGGHLVAVISLIGTLALVWGFINTVYTLHYAHLYYSRDGDDPEGGDQGGLNFPGKQLPLYPDFAYFAFTLGMAFQTADVAIVAPRIRRVALFHCFIAYLFNIGVVAFTINVLGGGS